MVRHALDHDRVQSFSGSGVANLDESSFYLRNTRKRVEVDVPNPESHNSFLAR
jgi:hypothetical protein